jgi:hypothetical protein
MRSVTLLAGVLGGAANVFVDIDHLPYWVYGIKAPVYFNVFGPAMGSGRFLHPAFCYIGLIGVACSGGLLVLIFLKNPLLHAD